MNKKSRPFLVIELLNTFSERESTDLLNFILCKYFNNDNYVVALLKALQKEVIHKKAFDDEVQCLVFQKVFPKKPRPKDALNKQQKSFLLVKMNALTRLTESFLCHEALQQNEACKTELLFDKLLEKNQFWLFKRHVTRTRKELDEQVAKGIDEYARQFKMEMGIFNHLHKKGELVVEDNLPELITNLDIYYLLNKLNLHGTCISLTHFSAQKSYDYAPMKAVQPLLQLPQYAHHPLIRMYVIALDLLKNNTPELYEQLVELLEEQSPFISKHNLHYFYMIAANFCGKKIKEGKIEYYERMLELYKKMEEKDLLREGNFIPVGTLKNVITLSCKLKEFEWAKEIIKKYHTALEKEHADSVYHFNMGLVAFYQNDFKTALSHFIRVQKVNLVYDINCRIMLLKSHYELDHEYDERTIRTFLLSERFIQSHKGLVSRDKKAYKNFVRILINIYNTRHGAGKMTAEKIKTKLEKLEFVSDKKWLSEKIEGLKNKSKYT